MVVLLAGVITLALWPQSPPPSVRRRSESTRREAGFSATTSRPADTIQSLEHELGLATLVSQHFDTVELDFEQLEREITSAADRLVELYADDHQGLHLAGKIFTRYKKTARAEPLLRASLALAPRNLDVRSDLADVLAQLGRHADAADLLAEVVQVAPEFKANADYVNILAESQIGIGKLAEASELLKAVLEQHPDSASNWVSLGKVQLQTGDFSAAESSLRKSVHLEPDNELAWLSLVQALAFQSKSAEAAEARERLATLRDSSLPQGDFEAQHLPSLKRFAASSFRSLAIIYQNHGESSTARKWLERSHAINPEDTLTLSCLMGFHRNEGDFDTAAKFCRSMIKLQPEMFGNYVNLANLSMEKSRVRTAEAALRLAAKRNLANGAAHLSLAKFMLMLHRPNEAIQPARAAVADQNSVDSRLVLIDALQAAGQFEAAKLELNEAVRLAPNDPRLQR